MKIIAVSKKHFSQNFRREFIQQSSNSRAKISAIDINDINKNVLFAEYAVRGLIPQRAAQLKQELANKRKLPFQEVIELNIGNPQVFGQKPFTFNREVLAGVLNEDLIDEGIIKNPDVIDRIKYYNSQIKGNVGAYTESVGYPFVRETVRKFIHKRDGLLPDLNDIIMLDGASEGIHMAMQTLISHNREGVMIPIPQYPLYSASVNICGGQEIHYYLNEQKGWQIEVNDLQQQFEAAVEHGIRPKILVVINPGNPTGQVLSKQTISDLIKFSYKNGLIIFADEVYQDNIYKDTVKFHSFSKIQEELEQPYNETEIITFHSTSKGLIGECGIRGGFMHMNNIDKGIMSQIIKFKTINLCSNTMGQLSTDLMCNPPNQQDSTPETYEKHQGERQNCLNSLKQRAQIMTEYLNKMENITCNEIEGAMYAFPRINFSNKVLQEATRRKLQPDMLYCMEVLENTGIVMIPGSGFKQEKDTYHFRTTILIQPDEKLKTSMERLKEFNKKFHQFNYFDV